MIKYFRKYHFVGFTISILLFPILTGCDSLPPFTADGYVERFSKFVAEVEKKHKEYSDKDWEAADKKFETYSSEYLEKFKDELTPEQKKMVNQLQGQYTAFKTAGTATEIIEAIKESLENAVEKTKGFIDAVTKSYSDSTITK